MQVFTVTGLFAGQHNTKLHGTITGVIFRVAASPYMHPQTLRSRLLFIQRVTA